MGSADEEVNCVHASQSDFERAWDPWCPPGASPPGSAVCRSSQLNQGPRWPACQLWSSCVQEAAWPGRGTGRPGNTDCSYLALGLSRLSTPISSSRDHGSTSWPFRLSQVFSTCCCSSQLLPMQLGYWHPC